MRGCIGFAALLAAFFLTVAYSRADQTTLGVTLNATTGEHVEEIRSQAIPLVPLPMFEIVHTHKHVRVRAEIVPPIGPVPLAEGSSIIGTQQEPRLSYLDADVLFAPGGGRFAFGFGETVINQRTYYPPSPVVQASRVVGARYDATMTLLQTPRGELQARITVGPSLHGVQYTMLPRGDAVAGRSEVQDPERGSLVDASLRRRVPHGRYAFVYGLRFINYVAVYTANGALADRNHVLMPFVGFDWARRSQEIVRGAAPAGDPPRFEPGPRRTNETTFETSLNAASGSMNVSPSRENIPLPFAIVPEFSLRHRHRRFDVHVAGVLPRRNTNLFGSPQYAWSYIHGGISYALGSGRYAVGVDDVAINQHFEEVFGGAFLRRRNEGVAYSLRALVFGNLREGMEASVLVSPYLHSNRYATYLVPVPGAPCTHGPRFGPPPRCTPGQVYHQTFVTHNHGSLLDARLQWTVPMRRYRFSYGLRYINQTTDYGSFGAPNLANTWIIRNTSLLPFVSISVSS